MANREKITGGANERAFDEPIAGTARASPDDALMPGEELPEQPNDEEVAGIAVKLRAPNPNR